VPLNWRLGGVSNSFWDNIYAHCWRPCCNCEMQNSNKSPDPLLDYRSKRSVRYSLMFIYFHILFLLITIFWKTLKSIFGKLFWKNKFQLFYISRSTLGPSTWCKWNIWIPTLVIFLKDSKTYYCWGEYIANVYISLTRRTLVVKWNNLNIHFCISKYLNSNNIT